MRKERTQQGLHLIEGERLVGEALQSGARLKDAFIEAGHDEYAALLSAAGAEVYTVTRAVMESLCDTETPKWVCASVFTPCLEVPKEYPEGLLAALDRIQDPGNMGTMIRTADAMGCAGVLLGDGCTDPYAPKVLRASMGSMYHLPIWQGDLTAELQRLRSAGHTLIAGHLSGDNTLPEIGKSCTFVVGNEGAGVSEEVARLCEKYCLPMYGRAESLNASVAAGIIMSQIIGEMRKK